MHIQDKLPLKMTRNPWFIISPLFFLFRLCRQEQPEHGSPHLNHSLQHHPQSHPHLLLLQVRTWGWHMYASLRSHFLCTLNIIIMASPFCARYKRQDSRPHYRINLEENESYIPAGESLKDMLEHSRSIGSGSGSGLPLLVRREHYSPASLMSASSHVFLCWHHF